jgi:hypothetical protein
MHLCVGKKVQIERPVTGEWRTEGERDGEHRKKESSKITIIFTLSNLYLFFSILISDNVQREYTLDFGRQMWRMAFVDH